MSRVYVPLICLVLLSLDSVADRPNVLIIMADDCTHNDLPMFGGQNAKTPNLEQLASEGLIFNRAYLAEAMCQPCRAELYSGLYPMRNGCAWNHSACWPETLSMPHHLGKLGYRVALAGKVHVQPKKAFPFEAVGGFDKNCVRKPTQPHDLTATNEFIRRDDNEPFCLVVALVEPHVPWVMGDASAYPPQQLKLPPNIADTQTTREAFSRYLAEITYMDSQVGELLDALEDSGHARDTLVLFSSEQGSQFPGNKWTNWDTGVHTALIARWPGVVPVGKRTSAIVQYADVIPTLIDAAGGEADAGNFDGTSFLSVLKGDSNAHRKYAYGVHNNIPEGPPYPVRTITNGTYRYIRNLSPENLYIEKHLMGIKGDGLLNNPYWQTWVWDSWKTPKTYSLVQRYMHRPAEAIYHTATDPYEIENLAGTDSVKQVMRELSDELDRWLVSQGDPGVEQDTPQTHQAAKRGNHRFRPPAQPRQSGQPITRVLFGSCVKQEMPTPIFRSMLAEQPDVILFLGDNIYADTSDMAIMREKYAALAANTDFSRLRSEIPILATWDDHDFGVNDGGADFPMREAAEKEFLRFWNVPDNSPRRRRNGVYEAHIFGPPGKRLQIILLDTRFFRSPLKKAERRIGGPYVPDEDPAKTMLGRTQWKWLAEQLRLPADLRVIVTSVQCIAEARGQETWSNLPRERQRLFDTIKETQANGVILISGDRHWSELSRLGDGVPYPMYEMTSSSFNQIHPRGTPTRNRFRDVDTTYHRENYGVISIDWDTSDPSVTMQIRDIDRAVRIEKKIGFQELKQ